MALDLEPMFEVYRAATEEEIPKYGYLTVEKVVSESELWEMLATD